MTNEIQPKLTAFESVALSRRTLLRFTGLGLAAGVSTLLTSCGGKGSIETKPTPNLAKEKLLQEIHDLREKAKAELKLDSYPAWILVYADGNTFYIDYTRNNEFIITITNADKEEQVKQDTLKWFNTKGITEPEKDFNISWRILPKFDITAVPNPR